jgi:hypothetical protein
VAFFARKFEPVINQEIINDVDTMMGRDLIGKISDEWEVVEIYLLASG